jgi:hypothetical protein
LIIFYLANDYNENEMFYLYHKWSTGLDRFINKGHKKYFIHAKMV